MRILIVEDDLNLAKAIQECLAAEGYEVEVVGNVQNAHKALQNQPCLVILDWMLPDGQGLDFLGELRKQDRRLPVIFLSARAELVDRVLGLEMGANDYMTKPFEPRELLARIRARLRDHFPVQEAHANSTLRVGSLSIDRIRHAVRFRDNAVELVKKEFDLLVLLAESPEKVFSRDEILNKVWGYEVFPTTRTVDTHIMLLRQKLQDELIETVRSVGYRLRPL